MIWPLIVLIYLLVVLIPMAKILSKAGYSGWWCLLAPVPLLNLIMLWVFACAPWPNLRPEMLNSST
jgi:uncharacterized membrane protein YhaH (DUF805 family)